MYTDHSDQATSRNWRRRFFVLVLIVVLPISVAVVYGLMRFLPDRAVTYSTPEEHFKYGSTGGERESGFPYWIWKVLPRVCAEHLPAGRAEEGYAALGMLYENGKDLPVGVSKRRNLGLDRVFLNCAVCHTGKVRENEDAKPVLYLGMPAQQLNLVAFEKFFFECAADAKFRSEFIVPEIEHQAGKLNLLDKYVVYPVAISLMRERLMELRRRFSFALNQPEWGPGRVDTFNSAKVLFNFPMDKLPPHELRGASDYPSIWLQAPRKKRDDGEPMQLHWDGNNTMTEERNKSAAFGTGTTPPTLDLKAIGRIQDWLLNLQPPTYPFAIKQALADKGKPIYQRYCADCHGQGGRDFSGKLVGHVTPIAQIGTDRARLDSYTYDLAVNQSTLYAGYPHRFQHFRKTYGYANMPLDGIWLRGPYLHNGSVPNLRILLEPTSNRPVTFYRGNNVYDQAGVGFVSDKTNSEGKPLFLFDTRIPGNGNTGHEGEVYGTLLSAADKDALVEYMKTF